MILAPVDRQGTAGQGRDDGTITAVRTAGGIRTYIPGPGAGLVYVEWDGAGLVCAVSLRDLKLEPAEDERRR